MLKQKFDDIFAATRYNFSDLNYYKLIFMYVNTVVHVELQKLIL